jgi:hypothetical protein
MNPWGPRDRCRCPSTRYRSNTDNTQSHSCHSQRSSGRERVAIWVVSRAAPSPHCTGQTEIKPGHVPNPSPSRPAVEVRSQLSRLKPCLV